MPVVANNSVEPGTVRVVLAADYTGPGSGLQGGSTTPLATAGSGAAGTGSAEDTTPPPSPIITAGSDKPECVN